jgi:hypothetical protein
MARPQYVSRLSDSSAERQSDNEAGGEGLISVVSAYKYVQIHAPSMVQCECASARCVNLPPENTSLSIRRSHIDLCDGDNVTQIQTVQAVHTPAHPTVA